MNGVIVSISISVATHQGQRLQRWNLAYKGDAFPNWEFRCNLTFIRASIGLSIVFLYVGITVVKLLSVLSDKKHPKEIQELYFMVITDLYYKGKTSLSLHLYPDMYWLPNKRKKI